MDPAEVRRKNYFKNEDMPAAVPSGLVDRLWRLRRPTSIVLLEVGGLRADLRAMQESAQRRGPPRRNRACDIPRNLRLRTFGSCRHRVRLGQLRAAVLVQPVRGWFGSTRMEPRPSIIGTGPSGQSHQDDLGPDRVRSARDRLPTTSASLTATRPRVPDGHWQRSGAGLRPSTALPPTRRRARCGKRRRRSQPTFWRRRRTIIRFGDGGAHVVGTPGHTVSWQDIAEVAYKPHKGPDGMEAGLEAHALFSPGNATWPFGSHIAVVEVDAETGDVDILRYIAVDDCGNQINPMIVAGQLHGGLAQGIGQAMFEDSGDLRRVWQSVDGLACRLPPADGSRSCRLSSCTTR